MYLSFAERKGTKFGQACLILQCKLKAVFSYSTKLKHTPPLY